MLTYSIFSVIVYNYFDYPYKSIHREVDRCEITFFFGIFFIAIKQKDVTKSQELFNAITRFWNTLISSIAIDLVYCSKYMHKSMDNLIRQLLLTSSDRSQKN